MKSKGRELTLHVPGLLGPWPRALTGEVGRGLELPGLVWLLARARRTGRSGRRAGGEPESFERLAFGAFGYPPGEADVPAADLMWEGDSARSCSGRPTGRGEDAAPRISLRADPVHLRPDLDAARLFDSSYLDLSGDEAAELAGALDRHFAPDGIRIEVPRPDRWYVRCPGRPDALFHPPGAAAGSGAGGLLPAGNEGSLWRRRMNEAQMLLHDHPCNEDREARGELPVNSVWFWGAGEMPAAPRARFDEVRSDDPLVRALAGRSGARVRDLEARAASDEAEPRACLVAPGGDLYRAVAGRDVEAWRRELLRVEEGWLRPLRKVMEEGAVKTVVIDAGLRSGEAVFEAVARRWRLPSARAGGEDLAGFLLAEESGRD